LATNGKTQNKAGIAAPIRRNGIVFISTPSIYRDRRIFVLLDQVFSQIYPGKLIHVQHMNSHASNIRNANNDCTLQHEVFEPELSAGIEKRNHAASRGINAGDVRPLVAIAEDACEREVFQTMVSDVLLGKHMIDLMAIRRKLLREEAILTAMAGAVTDVLV
jgi:hypothetical protein